MEDIAKRLDLELLMAAFYRKLLNDPSISYIFIDVAQIDLENHLPHIVDFWEQNLLGTGSYRKNVLKIHLDLNALTPLMPAHFETWLAHLYAVADEMFKGENTDKLKTRALSIATVMQIKVGNQS